MRLEEHWGSLDIFRPRRIASMLDAEPVLQVAFDPHFSDDVGVVVQVC